MTYLIENMKAVLRKATSADEDTLAEIERACFARPHWTAVDFSKYEAIVAELDGKVVAFAVKHQVFEAVSNEHDDSEYEILNIAVLPAYRRLGLGRALLQAVMQNSGTYFLEVREGNAGARSLYRSLGFQQVGHRPHYYQHPDETAIVMRVKRC